MKKLTICVFIVCMFSSCIEEKKNSIKNRNTDLPENKIQIAVKFDSKEENQEVNLNFVDDFMNTQSFAIIEQDTTQHDFEIKSDKQVFLMDWTINQVYYLLYPNEKITIQAATNTRSFLKVTSSTSNQVRENELTFFKSLSLMENAEESVRINEILGKQVKRTSNGRDMGALLAMIELAKYRKNKNTAQAYQFIKRKYNKRIEFLKGYEIEHPVSNQFHQIISKFFQFEFESSAFDILKNAVINQSKITKELSEISIQSMKADSRDWLFIPTYQRKLKNYLAYSYLKLKITATKDKIDFITKEFDGKNKDFCIFLVLKDQHTVLLPSEMDQVNHLFSKKGKKYHDYIKKNQEFYSNAAKNSDSKSVQLQSFTGAKMNFENLIKSYKGKVVLLDFWASWCKPCKADMPFSKQLHEDFKGKNVAFVYLSLDKKYNDWHNEATSLKLKENSFIVDNGFNSKLGTVLKIKTIPRYILINKNGTMVDLDAPRPGNHALKKKIMALL